MEKSPAEKRRYPRIDTSRDNLCRIKVFGVKGRPLEGQILNLSLGGVAFISHWKNIAKAVKRFTTKVRIHLPSGVYVDANTTLRRVKPGSADEHCICVYELTDMNKANTARLRRFIPRNQELIR